MDDLTLAGEVPAATREQWLELVQGVLKGADFEKRLVSRTYDGVRIEPLYSRAEGAPRASRAVPGPWQVIQRVDHPDPAAANAIALADLEGGANGLSLLFDGAATARGFGLRVGSVDELDRALAQVQLDLLVITLEGPPFRGDTLAAAWLALTDRRGLLPASLTVDFGLDPIGDLMRTGAAPAAWPDIARSTAATAASLREAGFRGTAIRVDGRPTHEAGGSEGQELAGALATGLAYLRALEAHGHSLETARSALSFLLVADADEFLTVAKFRAFRRLWARLEEACGLRPEPIRLQAETAWRMTTRRDPWVNLLRVTMATFSAGIGGADAITVLPFTSAVGLPDAFARRLARNTQLVLLEEAQLWRVADPAAGAGGFEALTAALCERAWTLFQEIEREGGMVESLRAGAWQDRVAAVRAERARAIAHRQDPLTGTSEFPDLREAPVAVMMPAPDDRPAPSAPALLQPLPSMRLAEPFEQLRDASDAILARTGTRPRVFLANLGPIAAFTARSSFARNVFEAGGIEAITNDGFPEVAALAEAYRRSGAPLACLCGSDEVYEQQAVAAAEALRSAGCRRIYLAGRPGPIARAFEEAGVSGFIFPGADVVQALTEALEAA